MVVTFIGPTLLSGIGQMLHKHLELFPGSVYHELKDLTKLPMGDVAVAFALPIPMWIDALRALKKRFRRLHCMTICETETVHEAYGDLFAVCPDIIVASEFCKRVFEAQFPGRVRCTVVAAYVPPVPQGLLTGPPGQNDPGPAAPTGRYVFYHIGNIIDQRKNIKAILEAFMRLNKPGETELVLKATCLQAVEIRLPGVRVINGLVSDEEIRKLHRECHCYVSFSSSEGIGMGAVEAALHSRPVIITDYGGAPEYIKTPYLIPCGRQEIPRDDFLFKKGMLWGKPDPDKLLEYMTHAFENRVETCEHPWTRTMVSRDAVLAALESTFEGTA